MDWAPFLYDANLCGYPALSLPIGFGDDGLPIAIQVLGRRSTDGLVLAAGETIEAIVGDVRWPPEQAAVTQAGALPPVALVSPPVAVVSPPVAVVSHVPPGSALLEPDEV